MEEKMSWIRNKEEFPYIKQLPNYCVPCSVENILKYHGHDSYSQVSLNNLIIRKYGKPGLGFVEYRETLAPLLGEGFTIELRNSSDETNNTVEKTFENIKKAIVDCGVPVAVSFKRANLNGEPVEGGAHIRVALACNTNKIRFFEPENGHSDFIDFDLDGFRKWLNTDHHLFIIKEESFL